MGLTPVELRAADAADGHGAGPLGLGPARVAAVTCRGPAETMCGALASSLARDEVAVVRHGVGVAPDEFQGGLVDLFVVAGHLADRLHRVVEPQRGEDVQ